MNGCFYRVTVKICIGDWNCNGWHWLIDPKFISIFPNSKNIVFISGPGYRVLGNLVFVWSSETEQSKFSMLPSRKISVLLTHIGKYRKLFPKNGRWLRGYSGNFSQVIFMSTYPWKKNSQKLVMTQRLFRKLFPGPRKSINKYLLNKKSSDDILDQSKK